MWRGWGRGEGQGCGGAGEEVKDRGVEGVSQCRKWMAACM